MPECPHCHFNNDIQATVDTHVDDIHEDGAGVLIPSTVVDKTANAWDCTATGMVITTNYHGEIINDQETIVSTNEKMWAKVCIVRNIPTEAVPNPTKSVTIFERFGSGEYGVLNSSQEEVQCLREFSVIASGTELVVEA